MDIFLEQSATIKNHRSPVATQKSVNIVENMDLKLISSLIFFCGLR